MEWPQAECRHKNIQKQAAVTPVQQRAQPERLGKGVLQSSQRSPDDPMNATWELWARML